MEKTLNIRIPEPCHENWQQMTPEGKGRFCNACSKVVVDFTAMSNEDIINHLRTQNGKTCGRFRNEQLSLVIKQPQRHDILWPFRKIAALWITGITLLASSCRPATTGTPEIPITTGDTIYKSPSSAIDTPYNIPHPEVSKPNTKLVEPEPIEHTKGEIEITSGIIAIDPPVIPDSLSREQ